MSPLELASYDIVLVTYETLRAELNYANSHEGLLAFPNILYMYIL